VINQQLRKEHSGSERHHFETGDRLEVLNVERSDIEADIEGRCPDIRSSSAMEIPLAACSPSMRPASCDWERDRMHDQVAGEFVGEGFAAYLVGSGPGPVDTVRQLDDADGRQGTFYVAASGADAQDDWLDGLSASLARDEDAGVENQTQRVSPMPTYRGACGCG